MLPYDKHLKQPSRLLRTHQTDAEQILWARLRKRQIANLQFYRQKPIAGYIVDFYCPKAKLVIEVDGAQHFTEDAKAYDAIRDAVLNSLKLRVLRFSNQQVEDNILLVLDEIRQVIANLPQPLLYQRGG